MRSQHALVVRDAGSDARLKGDSRWSGTGIVLKDILCAPVEVSGRYLGLIELANPLDERPFDEGDGNALSYIGQQYAEFVASRGVAIDHDAILAPPKK
jgi:GAF domain-containing protein